MATLNSQIITDAPNVKEDISYGIRKPVCTNCKKRKIKCDFELPCFQCKSRNVTCEYPKPNVKSPNEGQIVNSLMKKVDQLKKELEDQKQMVNYWRSLSESTNTRQNSPTIIRNIRRTNTFSKETQQFISNVTAAVTSVSNAFTNVIKAVMPSSTIEYNVVYASMIWNRLLDMTPEDCVENIKSSCSPETATQLLLHCTIFALGCRLYDRSIADLAEHFHLIAMKLINSGWIDATRDDTAEQWILSLMYTMFYNRNRFLPIGPLWERASELLVTLPNLENDTYIEIALTLVVFNPLKCNAEMKWLQRLDQAPPFEPIEIQFLRSAIRLCLALARVDPANGKSSDLWDYMVNLEDILNRMLDIPYYKFYGVLVYTLKSISAFVGSPDPPAEIAKCTQIISRFYSEITDSSQRYFLSRTIEHYRFVLSSKSITLPDGRKVTPMADVLYNIIIQITGAEPDSELEQSLTNMGLKEDDK